MLVKAVLEWQGPAGFDELVDIGVGAARIGTKSFDVRYTAAVGDRPACTGVITYVSVSPARTTRRRSPTRCAPARRRARPGDGAAQR